MAPGRPRAQLRDARRDRAGQAVGGGAADPGVLGGGGDQIGGSAAENVAERRKYLKRKPFRCSRDQALDLGGGQVDAALVQKREQFGGVEPAAGGHQFAQVPGVADGSFHAFIPFRESRAAAMVASSWRRRVRVRKSEDTQV